MNSRTVPVVIIMLFAAGLYAQDTVYVDPGYGTLNDAVNDPANQGKVFKLQSGAESVYVMTNQINNVGWHLQIVGEESDDIPPLIFRDTTSDKVPLFVCEGDLTARNLFIVYHNPAGEKIRKEIFLINSDSVNVTVDKVICTGGRGWFVSLANSHMVNLSVTNCLVCDGYKPDEWYREGTFVWLQGNLTGDYYIANNTVFNMDNRTIENRRGNPPTPIDNLVIEHNTFYVITKDAFEQMYYNTIDVRNNLFVDCWCAGYAQPGQYNGFEFAGDFYEWFDANYPGNEAGGFFEVDTLPPEWSLPENERSIVLKNNVRASTQKMRDWRAQVNALDVPFLSGSGQAMFNAYDNFIFENNIDEGVVDIEFTMPLPESHYDKVIAWADAVRLAQPPVWREWDPDGDEDSFTNPWPLPLDLSYDYTVLKATEGYDLAGDDGYPVGDLNWFPEMKADWDLGVPGPLTPILTTAVGDRDAAIVEQFRLNQNYPNPFNPGTVIEYSVGRPDQVTLSVYNMMVQEIRTLVNRKVQTGHHSVIWDGTDRNGRNVGNGIYYASLRANGQVQTIKMILMR